MKIAIICDHHGLISDDQQLINAFNKQNIDVIICDWQKGIVDHVDGVLIRTPWNYASQSIEFLNLLNTWNDICPVINSPSLIEWNIDKKYLVDWYEVGLPVVATKLVTDYHPLKLKSLFDTGTDHIVIKPRVGAGGKNTFLLTAADEMKTSVLTGQDVLVQPYIESIKTEGEYSFIFFDHIFSHALLKKPISGEFRVQAEHGGTTHSYIPTESELAQVKIFLEKIDCAYARVDVVRFNQSFLLMELEVIEPELFFRYGNQAEDRLVQSIIQKLK